MVDLGLEIQGWRFEGVISGESQGQGKYPALGEVSGGCTLKTMRKKEECAYSVRGVLRARNKNLPFVHVGFGG